MICIIIILTLLRQYRIDPMSELKKVLIVTYYWPPAGGPAIQRTLKFVKYMRFFGWEPVILTVENGEYPAIDPSLIQEFRITYRYIKQKLSNPSNFTGC